MKCHKCVVTLVVVILLAGGIQLLRLNQGRGGANQRAADPKSYGQPSAVTHIVVYSDFQCPACAKGAQVIQDYIHANPGKVYIQFRHYPFLTMHPHAMKLAVYAECASRQNQFFSFHDALFAAQVELTAMTRIDERLREIARETGLDDGRMQACVSDDQVMDAVLADREEGVEKGVRATPTYFVNGEMFVGAKGLGKALGLPAEGQL